MLLLKVVGGIAFYTAILVFSIAFPLIALSVLVIICIGVSIWLHMKGKIGVRRNQVCKRNRV